MRVYRIVSITALNKQEVLNTTRLSDLPAEYDTDSLALETHSRAEVVVVVTKLFDQLSATVKQRKW